MMKGSETNKKCLHLMINQTKDFIFFLISTAVISVIEVLLVVILKSFVEQVVVTKLFTKISLHVVPFVLSFIALCMFLLVRSNSKTNMTTKVCSDLIKDAHKSILNSELNELSKDDVEEVTKKIVSNSEFITKDYLQGNILPFIESLVALFVFLVTSFIVQPVIALILMISMPFYFILIKGVDIFNQKFEKKTKEAIEDNEERIAHSFKRIRNIKLMNGIQYEKELFETMNDDYVKASAYKTFFELVSKVIIYVLFVGMNIAIALGLGGLLFKTGTNNISAGVFIFFAISVPFMFMLLYKAMHYHLSASYVDEASKELAIISSLRCEVRSEPITSLDEIHSLKFRDIVCVNENNEVIANKVSFELKKAEKLGILSLNKSSKDALFSILTKMSKPKEGSILINNCDISKINTLYLRTIIASIFDDSCVYEETIMENIIYPDAFDEYKYNDALYRSGLKDIVNHLPDKDQTMITEDFMKYENNAQEIVNRIIFANAFYKDAKIYVLNDATLNYLPTTENELLSEIAKLKNKIVITLTDKAYLLNKYDKILVLDNGEPIEYGKYDELMLNKESAFYKAIKKAPSRKAKVS